jgi:hypothetical protein
LVINLKAAKAIGHEVPAGSSPARRQIARMKRAGHVRYWYLPDIPEPSHRQDRHVVKLQHREEDPDHSVNMSFNRQKRMF